MNIFIVPSWYPSPSSPYSGIFLREQAIVYSNQFPADTLAISHWGTNDHRLLLEASSFYQWPRKVIFSKNIRPQKIQVESNLLEYFNPALTWSRRFFKGNLKKIVASSAESFESFEKVHGTPDIIHAHIAFPGGYVAGELSRRYNVPYVVMENMSPFPMPGLQWKFDEFGLAPLRSANKVIAVSKNFSAEMASFGVEATVVPNFIDDQFYLPEEGIQESRHIFQFLSVGRLEHQKGHQHLIEACQILLKSGEEFEVKVIGSGSLGSQLASQIANKGLDHCVELTGPKGKEEIRDHLQKCDAFVFPSLHESFGIAPLEAIACGKPIIGTGKGEVPEMINEHTGILIDSANTEALAEAMGRMIRNKDSYQSKKIRSFYEQKYSAALTTTKLRKLYEEVIGQG